MRQINIFRMIKAERNRQDELHPNDSTLSPAELGSLLAEECGEAVKELNALHFGEPRHTNEMLVTELVHTAAMAVRILEILLERSEVSDG